jgi:hypothetical protein
MNRRKFLSIAGAASIATISVDEISEITEGSSVEIDPSSKSIDINPDTVESIIIVFENLEISARNMDEGDPIKLTTYGSINDNNIGEIKTFEIVPNNTSKLDSVYIDIAEAENYEPSYLFTGGEKSTVSVTFELSHPTITTSRETVSFVIKTSAGIVSSSGFSENEDAQLSSNITAEKLSGPDINTWNRDRSEKLVKIVSGSQYQHHASYNAPKGVIDGKNEYSINPRKSSSVSDLQKNTETEKLSGEDLSSWGLSERDKLAELVAGSKYEHNSSYAPPKGVIDGKDEYSINPRNDNANADLSEPPSKFTS